MHIHSTELKYVIVPVIKQDNYVFPEIKQPQISFVGRSNVGKSSVINRLTGVTKLARVSSSPGKTRQINYFLIDNFFFFVDLPGYGFAKVQGKIRKEWGKLIEQYFTKQKTLILCILIIDIRHALNAFDKMMVDWFENFKTPYIILLNKVDKLSNNEITKQKKYFEKSFEYVQHCKNIIPFSAIKGIGKTEVWKEINLILNVKHDV